MISEIENGIVGRISEANEENVLGYTLLKVDSYAGELNDNMRELLHGLPATLVMFGGADKIKTFSGNSRIQWLAKFNVLCAARSLRNEKTSRFGSGGEVGSYQITSDVIALLSGQTLGLEIDPIIPQRVVPVFNNRRDRDLISVYSVELATTFCSELGKPAADLDDFTTFHSNWDVPLFGNVSQALPADDTADATDHVNLET